MYSNKLANSKNNIAFYRKKKRLTQEDVREEFFKRTGKKFTQGTISSWENGKTAPDINILHVLASILEVNVNSLYESSEEETDQPITSSELNKYEESLRQVQAMVKQNRKDEALDQLEDLSRSMLAKLISLSTSYEKLTVQVKAVKEIMRI